MCIVVHLQAEYVGDMHMQSSQVMQWGQILQKIQCCFIDEHFQHHHHHPKFVIIVIISISGTVG